MEQVDRFVTADGTGLRVAVSGTGGPTLVLVHGWSQDLRTWDRVVEDLRRGGFAGRIVRYDHRGHGGSDAASRSTATIERAADDLAALITERVPSGPVVLAGHSMGGMTLMALAERHADLVARRVVGVAFVATASDDMAELTLGLEGRAGHLVARGESLLVPLTARMGHRAPAGSVGSGALTPSRQDSRGATARLRAAVLAPGVRALVFGHHARRADVLSVAEQALAAHPPSVLAFRHSIAEHHRTGALEALRSTPAVVLVGDRDRLCPQRHARVIADALPHAEIALYPGAGHMITFERAAEVAAHLAGLLAAASATNDEHGVPAPEPTVHHHEVVVVGAGPGLGRLRTLRGAGLDDVVVLKADAELVAAVWDEESRTWTVHTDGGAVRRCRFLVTGAVVGLDITGRDGRTLRGTWAEHGTATHRGVTVSDFPNLFLLLGPDTGLGHDSVVSAIEHRARYIRQAIETVRAAGMSGLDVRAEAQQRSNAVRPGSAVRYRFATRRFDPEDFELFGRAADAAHADTDDGGRVSRTTAGDWSSSPSERSAAPV